MHTCSCHVSHKVGELGSIGGKGEAAGTPGIGAV